MSTTINKLKFNNGNTYPTISVVSNGSQYIQGQNRQVIDCQFGKDLFDKIKTEISAKGNTDKITLVSATIDDNGQVTTKEFEHTNYSIVQRIALDTYMISAATDTTAEVNEMRTSLVLAQLTYLEVQQAEQAEAIAELSVMIAGGAK